MQNVVQHSIDDWCGTVEPYLVARRCKEIFVGPVMFWDITVKRQRTIMTATTTSYLMIVVEQTKRGLKK